MPIEEGEFTWGECKGTEGIGALVVKGSQHLVEAVQANLGEEPLNVGPRQAFVGLKTETCVLHNHSTSHLKSQERIWIFWVP